MQLLKLEILIWFSLLIIEHWTPLHQTPKILPIPVWNWAIFAILEALSERLQMLFVLQE
jgi:hypothetical protein